MIINCDNNLLVGDTSILRSDRIPIIKILAKNNFITKSKLIKKKTNNKEILPPIRGIF
jgi:hypothetical protein